MTIEEVRAQLEQRELQVYVDKAQFPNSQDGFLVRLRGVTPGQDLMKQREAVTVQFAPPPNEARAISVLRVVNWPSNQGPAIDSLGNAMTDRFGAPARKPGNAFNSVWIWLWGSSGSAMPLDPKGFCEAYLRNFSYQGGMSMGAFTQEIGPDKFTRTLKAGCTGGVYATLQGDQAGIRALGMQSVAVDFAAADKAIRATAEHMAKLQGAAANQQRDAAKKVKSDI